MPLFSFDIKEVMQKNIVNSLNIITTKMVCSPLSMSWYTFETYRGVCKKTSTCKYCSCDYMLINRKCAPRIDTFLLSFLSISPMKLRSAKEDSKTEPRRRLLRGSAAAHHRVLVGKKR